MPTGDLPEGPRELTEAAGGRVEALPQPGTRPLLAPHPGTPPRGHHQTRPSARPRRRRGSPLRHQSESSLPRRCHSAGKALRGGHRAGGAWDNPGALRLRLAPRRGARPTRLPAHPRVRPPRGGEPVGLLVLCPQRDGAGAALGESRASVLKGLLTTPTTTTELARQLGLAPAAVSAHLSRLKAAGLVEPHRSGKRVYYRLSCAGESLLGIFGETG